MVFSAILVVLARDETARELLAVAVGALFVVRALVAARAAVVPVGIGVGAFVAAWGEPSDAEDGTVIPASVFCGAVLVLDAVEEAVAVVVDAVTALARRVFEDHLMATGGLADSEIIAASWRAGEIALRAFGSKSEAASRTASLVIGAREADFDGRGCERFLALGGDGEAADLEVVRTDFSIGRSDREWFVDRGVAKTRVSIERILHRFSIVRVGSRCDQEACSRGREDRISLDVVVCLFALVMAPIPALRACVAGEPCWATVWSGCCSWWLARLAARLV